VKRRSLLTRDSTKSYALKVAVDAAIQPL